MGPLLGVHLQPLRTDLANLIQRLKQVHAQDFVSIPPIEAFNEGILLGLARLDIPELNRTRHLRAQELIRRLSSVGQVARPLFGQDPCYLRLPLLVKSKQAKEKLCDVSRQYGLGVSPLYPTSIREIPELQGKLPDNEFPAATLVADRLVTLPIHSLVSPHDVETICTLVGGLQEAAPEDQFCSSVPGVGKDHLSARA